MGDSLESNCLKDEGIEKDLKISHSSKVIEIHPLAFTIEFNDQKFDESKKSKVQERLSAFTLKHRRNPSLPDFRDVKNAKNCAIEKVVSPVNSQHVPVLLKKLEKSVKTSEAQWKSTVLKAAKHIEFQNPFSLKGNSGMKENFLESLKIGRRFSLDAIDDSKAASRNVNHPDVNDSIFESIPAVKTDDGENKSDTVSEAGTYTVDKENEDDAENDANRTHVLMTNEAQIEREYVCESKKNYHSSWINDWVRDVEQQNLLSLKPNEPPPIISRNLENANGSCGPTKIPSPLNTLGRKAKPRSIKPGDGSKLNGSACHKRSSSVSAKDYNENHGSESSLETESFLKATESVMTSMQNRMKFALEKKSPHLRRLQKRNLNYKERPHPPSTASDTDTNESESDAKTFKKPMGNPFTSARLNRAFSLRRAKADPEKDSAKSKSLTSANEAATNAKLGPTSKLAVSKPPSSIPFSRLDCGRFSMRSAVSGIRSDLANQGQKKEIKKSTGGNRSSSSLSSREVEFQNWRRRKSFDPMKAAAEGRKKELAKKAAMNHSLTLSINLGSGARARSSGGNPVLRSASFHSTSQVLGDEEDEGEGLQDQGYTDEQKESAASSHLPGRHSRPHNSPSNPCVQCKPTRRTPVFSSRSSLVSETHSSPSLGFKSNDLESLVLSAISETSFKLKLKSCRLLKKLNHVYETGEEKSFRIRDEIGILESSSKSAKNSPVHQAISRDLSTILKNLKGVENVFNVLEDVLFDENLEIYVSE